MILKFKLFSLIIIRHPVLFTVYLLAYRTENFTCSLKVYYGIELKGSTFNVQLVMWMEDLKQFPLPIFIGLKKSHE